MARDLNLKKEKNKLMSLFRRLMETIKKEGLKNTLYRVVKFLVWNLIRFKKECTYKFYGLFFESVIREVNGFRMHLDLKDEGICKDLFHDGKRELIFTDYLLNSNILKEGDVVLDIGANIGYCALIESKLVGDQGKVYAVEPISNNINILKKNISLNNCKNIEIFNLAIGDTDKKSKIYVSDRCNLCSLGRKPSNIIGERLTDVLTVDTFLKDKDPPNVIRMDVEGYEYNIVKGMSKILENDVKILMEIHGPFLTKVQLEEMFDKLKRYNFQVHCVIIDQKNKQSKVVKSLMDKLKEKSSFGFLDMTMEELLNWLIEERQYPMHPHAYPHVCLSKKGLEDI